MAVGRNQKKSSFQPLTTVSTDLPLQTQWGTIDASTQLTGIVPTTNGGTGLAALGTGVQTWLGTPSSANLAAAVTGETGTGALVFANTPTLITPLLGTPTSGNLSNCTALPLGSITGLGTGVGTFLATPSSANLASAVTDETGSGALMFGTAPTVTTSLTFADSANVILNTGTGTKIGTAVGQKLSFWNANPVAQPASANQAALSLDVDVTGADTVDLAAVNANFASIQTLVNQIRADLVLEGLLKGAA